MGDDTEQDAKNELEKEEEAAEQEVAALEEDPPKDLDDWPDGNAKYKTFGGPDGDTGYDDGPTKNLGESNVRHHEDGSISIKGEKVDNPEDYKGDPIPGGPTDPDAQRLAGDKVRPAEDDEGESDDDDSASTSTSNDSANESNDKDKDKDKDDDDNNNDKDDDGHDDEDGDDD